MVDSQVDPSRLEGEALRRWYRRSPAEIEQERHAREAKRYNNFFGAPDPDPGISRGLEPQAGDMDPGISRGLGTLAKDADPGINWSPDGANRWRGERLPAQELGQPTGLVGVTPYDGAMLDRRNAGPGDGGEFLEIGNPHNRRLKREYIEEYGHWPKTEDGRDYDVSHKRAIADNGTNTLDNIEPMHPNEHKAKHIREGDAGRWGRRASIARAFGGKVEPPRGGARVRGMGGLNPLDILGIMSGRIRTDSLLNFGSDLVGIASPDDVAREKERKRLEIQQQLFPDCPPGWQCI